MEITFVGGPHDGCSLNSGLGITYLWTNGVRCFRAPARERSLYKRSGSTAHFIGGKIGLCDCGVYRRRRSPCPVCGSALIV